MHIEYLVTKRPLCDAGERGNLSRARRDRSASNEQNQPQTLPTPLEQHLIDLDGEVRDERAAEILCFASAWAYSDLTTFAASMCPRGLYGEFVGINITNDAAFVNTTAYLFVSETQQLAILTIRGTELTSAPNWLADASAGMRMVGEGGIHGGFLAAAIAILPALQELLLYWSRKSCTLAEALYQFRKDGCFPNEVFPTLRQLAEKSNGAKEELERKRTERSGLPTKETPGEPKDGPIREPLSQEEVKAVAKAVVDELIVPRGPALYITGHSYGGAIAGLAGAELFLRPSLIDVKRRLRSIYTFGAPMWGDETIVDTLEEKGLGKRVFRHRYGNDIVPLLPGRNQGAYKHLGYSYKSVDGVWVRSAEIEEQVHMGLVSLLYGLFPFFIESIPEWNLFGVKWFSIPGLARLVFPYSWTDHKPDRYLRISQSPKVGFELIGDLSARASGLSCWRQFDNQSPPPPCSQASEDSGLPDHQK